MAIGFAPIVALAQEKKSGRCVIPEGFGKNNFRQKAHFSDNWDRSVSDYIIYSPWLESEPASCGDGLIEDSEQCDDGGTNPGDGCDASCQVEPGYSCDGEPSVCDREVPSIPPLGIALLWILLGLAGYRRLHA